MTTEPSINVTANETFFNNTTPEPTRPTGPGICNLEEYSRGVVKFPLEKDVGTEVAVTITVRENFAKDEFTQIISVVSTESPQIAIKYVFFKSEANVLYD